MKKFKLLGFLLFLLAGSIGLLHAESLVLPHWLSLPSVSSQEVYGSPHEKASVILVQESGQSKFQEQGVAKTLEELTRGYGIETIFQEGAITEASLSAFKLYASAQIRQETGLDYLKKGFISGAEYWSLVSEDRIDLAKAEEPGLYRALLLSYADALRHEAKVRDFLNKLDNAVTYLKKKVYSGELLRLDRAQTLSKQGHTPPRVYIEMLMDAAGGDPFGSKKFYLSKHLRDLTLRESSIDWQDVQSEAQDAFYVLSSAEKRELLRLTRHTLAPSKLTLSEEDKIALQYFSYLTGHILIENYPELMAYLFYLRDFAGLDRSQFARETEIFENHVFMGLTGSKNQKRLYRLSSKIRLARGALSLNRPDDGGLSVSEMESLVTSLQFSLSKFPDAYAILPEFPREEFTQMARGAKRFYRLARRADEFFYKNMLARTEHSGLRQWAVVATERRAGNLKKFFRADNISYQVVVPKAAGLVKEGGKERLLDLFAAEAGPFSGNGFVMDRPTLPAPLRSRLVYDLTYGREPLLWRLGESLGLKPEENVRAMLESLDDDTLRDLRGSETEPPDFLWLRNRINSVSRQASLTTDKSSEIESGNRLYQQATRDFDERFSHEEYRRFKLFAEGTEASKRRLEGESFEIIEKSIRDYEKGLEEVTAQQGERTVDYLSKKSAHTQSSWPWQVYLAPFGWQIQQFESAVPSLIVSLAAVLSEGRILLEYKPDENTLRKMVKFLETNTTYSDMPLSFFTPNNYWSRYESMMNDSVDSVIERILVKYGVSIYDAALWQITLAGRNDPKLIRLVNGHTKRLLDNRSGELKDLRAYGASFLYGTHKKVLDRDSAFFFRIISDRYIQEDPKERRETLQGFPNFSRLHHEDWKPITGEQAWAAILGPLQVARFKYGKNIPLSSEEMRLALSILKGVVAMKSEIGGIYHSPDGTHQKSPDDISNENNFSMYAALKMLRQVLGGRLPDAKRDIDRLLKGQEEYFKKYAFNAERGIFYQGGFYREGKFLPTKIFAVDVQTWGILALGPHWIDTSFGEGTAYQMWQTTKEEAGYLDKEGIFRGIGFTKGHTTLSVEWTSGAILAGSLLLKEYEGSHPDWAWQVQLDILSMRQGIEAFKTKLNDHTEAYLYANKRAFIPFGWWANPLPSMASSAWVVLIDTGFNPFIWGGGPEYRGPGHAAAPSYYTAKSSLKEAALKKIKTFPAPKSLVLVEEALRRSRKAVSAIQETIQRTFVTELAPPPPPTLTFAPNRLLQHDIEEETLPEAPNKKWEIDPRTLVLLAFLALIITGAVWTRHASRRR